MTSVYNNIWEPGQDNTPKRFLLKRTVLKLIVNNALKSKNLKYLHQAKKIAFMKMVTSSLKQFTKHWWIRPLHRQYHKYNDLIDKLKKIKARKFLKNNPKLQKITVMLQYHSAKAFFFLKSLI